MIKSDAWGIKNDPTNFSTADPTRGQDTSGSPANEPHPQNSVGAQATITQTGQSPTSIDALGHPKTLAPTEAGAA